MAGSISSYTTGILAELLSPLLMTIGFMIWDNQWTGSAFALNLYKCTTASVAFAIAAFITRRYIMDEALFPSDVFTTQNVGYLMLSSTLGILIGDWTWLAALRRIGARRVIVVDTIKPFLAAVFGWFILGERLKPLAWFAMLVTVVGISVVSLENERDVKETEPNEKEAAMPSDESLVQQGVFDPNDETKENYEQQESAPGTLQADVSGSIIDEDPSGYDSIEKGNDLGVIRTYSNIPSAGEQSPKRPDQQKRIKRSDLQIGYALSAVNAVFDTYGSLLTKDYGTGMTSWAINLIRFGFSAVCMIIISVMLVTFDFFAALSKKRKKQPVVDDSIQNHTNLASAHQEDEIASCAKDMTSEQASWYRLPKMSRRRWLLVSLGVVFLGFLCPALINYGLFRIALGLALTLGSTGPLYVLPLTWWIKKEKPTIAGCVGAVVAFAGIVLLSVSGQLP